MGDTKIEWTNKTWNPTRGCSRVSQGCTNCYAERVAIRFARGEASGEPQDSVREEIGTLIAPAGPFHGFITKVNGHPAWTGKVELIEHMLDAPLRWRKPQRIFVNSMSDLFHEALLDDAIDRVFAVMALCPQHTFQCLTKRPGRMYRYLGANYSYRRERVLSAVDSLDLKRNICYRKEWPLPNVHLGVSVEDQKTADERIPLLLQTPAAKRFVSYEPALASVDFTRHLSQPHWEVQESAEELRHREDCPCNGTGFMPPMLDQIIVGGESGPGARPFDIAWARNTVEQCKAAGVACFVKQVGAHVIQDGERRCKKDSKGGDMHEWPHEIRVRELI